MFIETKQILIQKFVALLMNAFLLHFLEHQKNYLIKKRRFRTKHNN